MTLRQSSARFLPAPLAEWATARYNRAVLSRSPELRRVASGKLFPARPDIDHIQAILDWMNWAIDASADSGFPQLVNIRSYAETGRVTLAPSYPETTGYALCTLATGHRFGLPTLPLDRMASIVDYLLSTQLASGAFPGPGALSDTPLSFDTGQILKGLVAYHRHVRPDDRVRAAMELAARWQASMIESDGSYSESSSYNGKRCYYAEASVGLYHAGIELGLPEVVEAAARNADWVLGQREGQWFRRFSFEDGEYQNLHGIAYTLRGLLDLGRHLHKPQLVSAASDCLENLTGRSYDLPAAQSLPGFFANGFERYQRNISPTGQAQTALCCFIAGRLFDSAELTERGSSLTAALKGFHFAGFVEPALNGGLPGSWPVTGPYMRCAMPNWAAKYFLDCLYVESGIDPLSLEG